MDQKMRIQRQVFMPTAQIPFPQLPEAQVVLRKEKICELQCQVDNGRNMITKYFDALFEWFEEYRNLLSNKLMDSQTVCAKMVEISDKKYIELELGYLPRIAVLFDDIMKEVNKYQERVSDTNKHGQGFFIEHNEKLKLQSELRNNISEMKNDQLYKGYEQKPMNLFTRKMYKTNLLIEVIEKNKIPEFMKNENFVAVQKFYERNKDHQLICAQCQRLGSVPLKCKVKVPIKNDGQQLMNCEMLWKDYFQKFQTQIKIQFQSYFPNNPKVEPWNPDFICKIPHNQLSSLNGKQVIFIFGNYFKLCLRMIQPFKASCFCIGSTKEHDLMPESESQYEVFKYLTIQMRKIYAVYDAICEFPVGLLIILLNSYQFIFTSDCRNNRLCKRNLHWDHGFGLLPPLYKDIWIRYDYLLNNSCYTYQRSQ